MVFVYVLWVLDNKTMSESVVHQEYFSRGSNQIPLPRLLAVRVYNGLK
jgi:hypothetical protein